MFTFINDKKQQNLQLNNKFNKIIIIKKRKRTKQIREKDIFCSLKRIE
jgi:hypothetical protein